MTNTKAESIVALEKLRLIESELFRLTSRFGVKTIDDLDVLVRSGKLSEQDLGEDFFRFDHLLSEKEMLEKELKRLSIKKSKVWESLQNLLGLPKSSIQTS